jgi:hypothetical protein
MKANVLGVAVLGALLAGLAANGSRAEDWQFRATVYGYFPSIEETGTAALWRRRAVVRTVLPSPGHGRVGQDRLGAISEWLRALRKNMDQAAGAADSSPNAW